MKSPCRTTRAGKRSGDGSGFCGSVMAGCARFASSPWALWIVCLQMEKGSKMGKMALCIVRVSVVIGLLLTGISAWGQATAIQGTVLSATGAPAAYGQVRVCLYTSSGIPCSPTATIYSDLAMTHQISNPYTSDQNGNYGFFVAAGAYLVQTSSASGAFIYSYPWVSQTGTITSGTAYSLGYYSATGTALAGASFGGVPVVSTTAPPRATTLSDTIPLNISGNAATATLAAQATTATTATNAPNYVSLVATYLQTMASPLALPSVASPLVNGLAAPDYVNIARPPLFNWLRSLDFANNAAVHVKLIGDSYEICDVAICATGPTNAMNRWPDQLRLNLQNFYGYGGTGIMPINFSIYGLHVNGENYPATTGTLDNNTMTFGPTGGTATTTALIHMPNGATITFSPGLNYPVNPPQFPYDTLIVYCMTTSVSGSIGVSIDGGAITGTACGTPTSSPTAHAVSIAAGTLKTHTAVFTSTGDSYIYAAEGTAGTTGVRVSNLGYGGSDSTFWGTNSAAQLAFSDLEPAGTALSIVMLQTNDIGHSIVPATTGASIQNIVTHEMALVPHPSVVLAIPPVSGDTGAYPASAYTAQQVSVYNSNPIDMVNIQWRWGTAYDYTSGLWSVDGVHPDDNGALDEGAQIFEKVMPSIPFKAGALPGAICMGGPIANYQCALFGFVYNGGGAANYAIVGPYGSTGIKIYGNGNTAVSGSLSAVGVVTGSNVIPETTLTGFTGTASGVTPTCSSAACTSASGALQFVSTTFTTGSITTTVWPATVHAPNTCVFSQDGGATWLGYNLAIAPTATGFTIANAVSIAGTTQVVLYLCH